MVATDFDAERAYDEEAFSTQPVYTSDRLKVVLEYFEPDQFIPVHAPDSDVVVNVESGEGLVRDGAEDHRVKPGDIVVVPAGESRGVHANAGKRLEALLVTSPPPTDTEHEPVRTGLHRGEFEPDG